MPQGKVNAVGGPDARGGDRTELQKWTSPCDAREALALWAEAFGEAEAALEAPQLDGSEAGENLDLLFALREDGVLVGTLHATISRENPALCGLSGMCVAPEYRGRGLAGRLLGDMLKELSARGVRTAFLGTDNPVAARLYRRFGFSFLPGSNVMARYMGDGAADGEFRRFGWAEGPFRLEEGSPKARIPLIPLALHRGSQLLLDANAGLLSCAEVTQRSCMGLYPKYAAIRQAGGAFFCAWDAAGTLGAVASALPIGEGVRADFFCCDAFYPAVSGLLSMCEARFGAVSLWIARDDAGKRNCVEQLGYRPAGERLLPVGRLCVPCVSYERPQRR